MVYIGAENSITPLGSSAKENFSRMLQGKSAVKLWENIGINEETLPASMFKDSSENYLEGLLQESIKGTISGIRLTDWDTSRTCLVFSTTKGQVYELGKKLEAICIDEIAHVLCSKLDIPKSYTVSNACVSGIMAINLAHDLIETNRYDHVLVVGGDLVTKFTLSGFQSFFAVSDEVCKPYDKNRKGINLGEGTGSVFLSKDKAIFKEEPLACLAGTTRNDANHISGPSRTGEGLFRTIRSTLNQSNIDSQSVDFVSAHGTATAFNDEMESQAFERAGLLETPMHSLKGYIGHTLGAAGIIETVIAMQCMRNNQLVPSYGYEESGVTHELNVIKKVEEKDLSTVLKTGSGFGGINSSLILKKI